LLTALLWSQVAHGEVTTDHQLWLNAAIRTELIDELQVSFTQHLRVSSPDRSTRQVIPELGVSYGLFEFLSIGIGGRYAFEKDGEEEPSQSARLNGDVKLEAPDIGPVELAYRFRFQQESSGSNDTAKRRLRNKGVIQFDTDSAIKPEVFYEHFMDPQAKSGHKAQKYRLGLGLGAKLSKHHRLKFKFFQDKEIDGDGDKERIASVGYRYQF